ncbi:MAG: Type 1 glutamine amidotransferase-like domain-containing protein [bacterium]|nr:Type 1 glutamine amidotransferase-like domain-containing protein [bacterium]
MNTKFILHGGYAGRSNAENDDFFKEILKDAPQSAKILLVYFAKEKDEYYRMQAEDETQFEKNKGEHDISFEIASPETFLQQIEQTDIIYLHGGNTSRLLVELRKYPNLMDIINGKVVAGESAGAYALSSCFYSKTEGGIFKGLGFVSVKTICHYIGENEKKLNECPVGLETLLLADYQYKVFQQNRL